MLCQGSNGKFFDCAVFSSEDYVSQKKIGSSLSFLFFLTYNKPNLNQDELCHWEKEAAHCTLRSGSAAAAAGPWPTFCQHCSTPHTLTSSQNSAQGGMFLLGNNHQRAKFARVATDKPDACGSVGDGTVWLSHTAPAALLWVLFSAVRRSSERQQGRAWPLPRKSRSVGFPSLPSPSFQGTYLAFGHSTAPLSCLRQTSGCCLSTQPPAAAAGHKIVLMTSFFQSPSRQTSLISSQIPHGSIKSDDLLLQQCVSMTPIKPTRNVFQKWRNQPE